MGGSFRSCYRRERVCPARPIKLPAGLPIRVSGPHARPAWEERLSMKTFLCSVCFALLTGSFSPAFGQSSAGEKALFAELPVVQAAALHTQTLEEAPANVTIISAAEI